MTRTFRLSVVAAVLATALPATARDVAAGLAAQARTLVGADQGVYVETEAGEVLAGTYEDPHHSDTEPRELTFGFSSAGRPPVVSHCERKRRVRIISARPMTRRERRQYEEGPG